LPINQIFTSIIILSRLCRDRTGDRDMCVCKRGEGERGQWFGGDNFQHAGSTSALLKGQCEDAIRVLAFVTLEVIFGSLHTVLSVVWSNQRTLRLGEFQVLPLE
jgi:hypothetical protein